MAQRVNESSQGPVDRVAVDRVAGTRTEAAMWIGWLAPVRQAVIVDRVAGTRTAAAMWIGWQM